MGKKVECIQSSPYLTMGKVYEVLSEELDTYTVIDDNAEESAFWKTRFRDVVSPKVKRVLCIDAYNVDLTENKVYEVLEERFSSNKGGGLYYTVIGDSGCHGDFWQDRFQEVEVTVPTSSDQTSSTKVYKVQQNGNQTDLQEIRAQLQFFRTSSHPENCRKCGAPCPCKYHP